MSTECVEPKVYAPSTIHVIAEDEFVAIKICKHTFRLEPVGAVELIRQLKLAVKELM